MKLKRLSKLLKQNVSPVFLGWHIRTAAADIRVDTSPVLFAMVPAQVVTITKEEVTQ